MHEDLHLLLLKIFIRKELIIARIEYMICNYLDMTTYRRNIYYMIHFSHTFDSFPGTKQYWALEIKIFAGKKKQQKTNKTKKRTLSEGV
jgi:hypothetical protein